MLTPDKQLSAEQSRQVAETIREEIARGPTGYTGSTIVLRRYLRTVRPARGRIYQEVHYEPGQAMQVDWGECGRTHRPTPPGFHPACRGA